MSNCAQLAVGSDYIMALRSHCVETTRPRARLVRSFTKYHSVITFGVVFTQSWSSSELHRCGGLPQRRGEHRPRETHLIRQQDRGVTVGGNRCQGPAVDRVG